MATGTGSPAADPDTPLTPRRVRHRPGWPCFLRHPPRRTRLDHLPPLMGQSARGRVTPAEYASPLARRVYDLRHACVSTWLNGGVPPAQVAEWAGHSVAVLLKVYAKCIDGQDQIAKRRIEDALRETDDAAAPATETLRTAATMTPTDLGVWPTSRRQPLTLARRAKTVPHHVCAGQAPSLLLCPGGDNGWGLCTFLPGDHLKYRWQLAPVDRPGFLPEDPDAAMLRPRRATAPPSSAAAV